MPSNCQLNLKTFAVGDLVESIFERGTIYRVTEFEAASGAYGNSNYVTLEVVKLSDDTDQYGLGINCHFADRRGRMANTFIAVYHQHFGGY